MKFLDRCTSSPPFPCQIQGSRWWATMGMTLVLVGGPILAQGMGEPGRLAAAAALRDLRQRQAVGDARAALRLTAHLSARQVPIPKLPTEVHPQGEGFKTLLSRSDLVQLLSTASSSLPLESLLEEWVARNPFDQEMRMHLYRIAQAKGDTIGMRRHAAHLPQLAEKFPAWKGGLILLLIALICWQALEAYRDFRRGG